MEREEEELRGGQAAIGEKLEETARCQGQQSKVELGEVGEDFAQEIIKKSVEDVEGLGAFLECYWRMRRGPTKTRMKMRMRVRMRMRMQV